MTAAAAWAGVILALLSFVYTEKRFRDRRRTRHAIGPEPGVLREKLRQLGSLLDEAITNPKDKCER
jgi:hypothetical protein